MIMSVILELPVYATVYIATRGSHFARIADFLDRISRDVPLLNNDTRADIVLQNSIYQAR